MAAPAPALGTVLALAAGMRYATFLAGLVLPATAHALVRLRRARRATPPPAATPGASPGTALATLTAIAVAYTTPWETRLIRERVWSYGRGRVLARVGVIPAEEYAFMVLQTLLAGSRLLALAAPPAPDDATPPRQAPAAGRARELGAAAWLLLAAAGAALARRARPGAPARAARWRYLGALLAWAAPIHALHWGYGGDRLWARRGLLARAVLPITLQLALLDRLAIGDGIWRIHRRTSSGRTVGGLPIEEALFFLLTNAMVAQGVLLLHEMPHRTGGPRRRPPARTAAPSAERARPAPALRVAPGVLAGTRGASARRDGALAGA